MELLKSHKRRSALNEILYLGMNIGLAVLVLLSVILTQSAVIAIVLVLISKWRIFAVRPRFWLANLIANMVDIIVGVSVALLIFYGAYGQLVAQIALAVLYAIWLIFIKPRSKRSFAALQSLIAIFFGLSALAVVSYSWPVSIFVIISWIIAYCATRHVLSHFEEPLVRIYSLIWASMIAQFAWVSYHWMFAYHVAGENSPMVSQYALFISLLSFTAHKVYVSYKQHGRIKKTDVLPPIILTVATILILIFVFNQLSVTSSL